MLTAEYLNNLPFNFNLASLVGKQVNINSSYIWDECITVNGVISYEYDNGIQFILSPIGIILSIQQG